MGKFKEQLGMLTALQSPEFPAQCFSTNLEMQEGIYYRVKMYSMHSKILSVPM